MDVWSGTCMTFIMSAMVEFFVINWFIRSRDKVEKEQNIDVENQVKLSMMFDVDHFEPHFDHL